MTIETKPGQRVRWMRWDESLAEATVVGRPRSIYVDTEGSCGSKETARQDLVKVLVDGESEPRDICPMRVRSILSKGKT